MPQRDESAYRYDVCEAATRIIDLAATITFEQYTTDWVVRSAVERQFGIIGEAVKELLRLDPTLAERITATDRIISFRNRLIHTYADIDHVIVWEIIQFDLPVLLREVQSLG